MSYGNLVNVRRPGILDTIEGLWPYSYILTVSRTNPAAMFKTIQSAIDYQEDKSLQDVVILCDAGIYPETLTFTLGSVCLTSLGVNGEVVITSTDAITIIIDAPNVTLKNIAIDNNETGTDGTCVQVAANRDGTIFDNCRFNITNATVTNAYCADINGGDETGTLFRECTFFLDAGATLNTAIDVATDCVVHIEDGQIESLGGTNYAINSASGAIIQLNGPRFISGSINGAGTLISDRTLDVDINGPITLTNSLNGKNPTEAVISSSQNTTDVTMTPSGSNLQFANWTIQNDGAGGAGISHTALTNAQSGLVIDGCVIERITGSCTTSIAFSSTAGDTLARNCSFNAAAGLTINYAVYLVTAGSTVVLQGGEVLAGSLVTAHASAVLELRGVKLASGVTFDTSGGGIIKGWYLDSSNKVIILGGSHVVMPSFPNGDFSIWQRGTSFATIADGTYVADNWRYNKVGVAVHTVSQSTDVPTVAQAGRKINYSLLVDCTTADSSIAAGDFVTIRTCLEGYDWVDYAQVAFPYSFWHKHTKTGTYCVAFRNSGLDRSFVAEYTQAVTDTWEFATVWVEPSPTAGTWDYANGIGLIVTFALSCGSTFQTTAGSWQTGDFRATANQVNATDSTSNNFMLALVGSVPDDSFKAKLERCQRYFWKSFPYATAPAQNAGTTNVLRWAAITAGATTQRSLTFLLPTVLRTSSPTITFYNPSAANAQVRDANAGGDCTATATGSIGDTGFNVNCTGNAGTAANNSLLVHATAAADM